jgi:hypothetical protein
MTWLQVLEQLESYTRPEGYHDAWRLGWEAKLKLSDALKAERQSMVTREMGS